MFLMKLSQAVLRPRDWGISLQQNVEFLSAFSQIKAPYMRKVLSWLDKLINEILQFSHQFPWTFTKFHIHERVQIDIIAKADNGFLRRLAYPLHYVPHQTPSDLGDDIHSIRDWSFNVHTLSLTVPNAQVGETFQHRTDMATGEWYGTSITLDLSGPYDLCCEKIDLFGVEKRGSLIIGLRWLSFEYLFKLIFSDYPMNLCFFWHQTCMHFSTFQLIEEVLDMLKSPYFSTPKRVIFSQHASYDTLPLASNNMSRLHLTILKYHNLSCMPWFYGNIFKSGRIKNDGKENLGSKN